MRALGAALAWLVAHRIPKRFFGGARVLVKIYRLGTVRGPEDRDPRKRTPPCARCSRVIGDEAAPLVPPL